MEEFILDNSFTGETGEYDLTLIVDGHKIRVLKAVLCVASPVFGAMLQSEFKEKDQAEVELPGKKHQDFVEFLGCFYPDKLEHVTDDSVYRILPLAVEYQVKVLEKRCHMLLIKLVKTTHLTDAIQIYRHIQLAELYKLEDLRNICISAASDFELSEMGKAALKYSITVQTLVQVHDIARRKQELNKRDDQFLLLSTNMRKNASYENIIKSMIESANFNVNRRKMAARLCYRYFPNDEALLENVIKSLKSDAENVDEEITLLPEIIKKRLDMDHFLGRSQKRL